MLIFGTFDFQVFDFSVYLFIVQSLLLSVHLLFPSLQLLDCSSFEAAIVEQRANNNNFKFITTRGKKTLS